MSNGVFTLTVTRTETETYMIGLYVIMQNLSRCMGMLNQDREEWLHNPYFSSSYFRWFASIAFRCPVFALVPISVKDFCMWPNYIAELGYRHTLGSPITNLMATLYYAEHVLIAQTHWDPYFCTGQESEFESVPVSKSGNVFKSLRTP